MKEEAGIKAYQQLDGGVPRSQRPGPLEEEEWVSVL
jgi:hypothetical protein